MKEEKYSANIQDEKGKVIASGIVTLQHKFTSQNWLYLQKVKDKDIVLHNIATGRAHIFRATLISSYLNAFNFFIPCNSTNTEGGGMQLKELNLTQGGKVIISSFALEIPLMCGWSGDVSLLRRNC